MDLGIAGKHVLITGASQGIGAGLARAFAAERCDLELTARSAEKLKALKAEIMAASPDVNVRLHPLDLTAAGAPERLVDAAGDIDILVNNAGAIPSGTLLEIAEEEWRAGWELKVFGYINVSRVSYPRMVSRGGGVIVNVIGSGGEILDPRYIAGVTGNAGLMAFTRALGGRSLSDNIRVVGVNPGPVNTDRVYDILRKRAKLLYGDEERYSDLTATYPLGRPAHVHEITDTIPFLASPRSVYTTGTIVTVDGGIASRHSIV